MVAAWTMILIRIKHQNNPSGNVRILLVPKTSIDRNKNKELKCKHNINTIIKLNYIM